MKILLENEKLFLLYNKFPKQLKEIYNFRIAYAIYIRPNANGVKNNTKSIDIKKTNIIICYKFVYIYINLYNLKGNNLQIFEIPIFTRTSWNWASNYKRNSFLL